MVADDGADIIWIALGAPKQENSAHRLEPHLAGEMIAVGAAFKFFTAGQDRAPRPGMDGAPPPEFLHRILSEPKKQIKGARGYCARFRACYGRNTDANNKTATYKNEESLITGVTARDGSFSRRIPA